MSGLAEFVLTEGGRVSGSDIKAGAATERLAQRGVTIHIGHGKGNVPAGADLVVHSAAVKADNPELLEARRRGTATLKYAEFLGQLMTLRLGIAVSGTHGKSTTTALAAYVLSEAGLDPSFVIGADVPQLKGGAHVGNGPHLVVEACEYDRSFLNFAPHAAAVLNVEEDHLDYFRDLADVRDAFADFASRTVTEGLLVVNGADPGMDEVAARARCRVETFGIGGGWDWHAENLHADAGRYAFDVYRRDAPFASVNLALAGEHHVLNALAATALSAWAGAPAEAIGGDVFQITGLDQNRAAVFIADVSGHGVRAALVSSIVKTVIDYIDLTNKTPTEVLKDFNSRFRSVLGPMTPQIYATGVIMIVDGSTRTLSAAIAGHPAPLLVSKSHMTAEPIMSVDDFGPALGFLSDPDYPTRERKLSAGDIILAFTDGIYEIMNAADEMYGLDRLQQFVADNAQLVPRDLIQRVIRETEAYLGTSKRPDDVCMVSVEVQ